MQQVIPPIIHRGEPFELPFHVFEGSTVNVYSLLDYDTACKLCANEHFKPTVVITDDGDLKAAGFAAAADNRLTSSVPYAEWSLGIFVTPREQDMPEVNFTNETSLFFQTILDNELVGNMIYCPKLYLNEQLPIEIGYQYYGIPKEPGEIHFSCDNAVLQFSVAPQDGPWIMRASFPSRRGMIAKFRLAGAMIKAFGLALVFQSLKKKEFTATLAGSSRIAAKKAIMKVANDPKTEMFSWCDKDCRMEINPDSEWGTVLIDLGFTPLLVCHVPNLNYEFSEPINQIG